MSEIGVPEDPGNRRRILLVNDLMREHYGTYQDFSSDYIMNIAHRLVDPVTGFSATLNQTLLTCALRENVLFSRLPSPPLPLWLPDHRTAM